ELGGLFQTGKGLPAPDAATAMKWYDQAAAAGDANAMLQLGRLHLRAKPPDVRTAFQWFEKAAGRGSDDAALELGNCYVNGLGVRRDPRKAVSLYKPLAERGNVEAMFRLGKLGFESGDTSARPWLLKAAEAGNVDAMCYVGQAYSVGSNVDQDNRKALDWWTRA